MRKARKAKAARRQARHPGPKSGARKAERHASRWNLRQLAGIAITGIGLFSAYVTIFGYFAPRISVQPIATLDPKDASSAVFAVTNESPVDLHDVAIGCRFLNFYLQYTESGIVVTKREGSEQRDAEIGMIHETVPFDAFHRTIQPKHSGTMKLPFPPNTGENLDIEVVVHYRPGWYFRGRTDVFRFVSAMGADGAIHWLPHPERGVDPYTPRSTHK